MKFKLILLSAILACTAIQIYPANQNSEMTIIDIQLTKSVDEIMTMNNITRWLYLNNLVPAVNQDQEEYMFVPKLIWDRMSDIEKQYYPKIYGGPGLTRTYKIPAENYPKNTVNGRQGIPE